MSLILDALKKSERERQRDKAPGLQSIHQPLPTSEVRSHKHWWMLGVLLIGINGGLLGYWRLHESANTGPAIPADPIQSPSAPTNAPQLPVLPANNVSASSPASEYTNITPVQAGTTQPQAESSLRIEEVGELPDAVRDNLPAMTFSFHVYSTNPQQRTIIINNRRVREGDDVTAGIRLQEITEDGVILLSDGHRIHIGVLSGW